jgi:phage shock protein PspC (stress-responsive transcriptional regulator)
MESSDVSSQEKLDQMLRDGSISEEDYRRLSQAMERPSEGVDDDGDAATQPRRLRKSWQHGVIGGLCAGFAGYFDLDPPAVRVLLVVTWIVLGALTGVGFVLVPLLYFALCAFLPWDDHEKAKTFLRSGHPRLFVVAVAALFVVLPGLYSYLVLPRLESIYADMGIRVWTHEFQQTMSGRAIDGASEYRSWSQLNDGAVFFATAAAALFTLVLGVVYSSLCQPTLRKGYAIVTVGLGGAWVVFLVWGTLCPLVMLIETTS